MPITQYPKTEERIKKTEFKTATASWYGPGFYGNETANGETYTKETFTFAHNTLPVGTRVLFKYKGRTAVGRCNDRGPYEKTKEGTLIPHTKREFDLGHAIKEVLKFSGVEEIEYKILTPPPIFDRLPPEIPMGLRHNVK